MFVTEADTTCLRQGDILSNVPFPLIKPQEFAAIGTYSPTGGPDGGVLFRPVESTVREQVWFTSQILTRLSFAAVISQCCDLAPRNARILLPTIALARLVPITSATLSAPEKLASLRANKDPRDGDDPGIIKLFYIPGHEKLGGVEWTVDYNQVFSISSTEFPSIMRNKILQMNDDSRIRFKIKLAWCLGRLTDEELTLGHPWLVPAGPAPKLPDQDAAAE